MSIISIFCKISKKCSLNRKKEKILLQKESNCDIIISKYVDTLFYLLQQTGGNFYENDIQALRSK